MSQSRLGESSNSSNIDNSFNTNINLGSINTNSYNNINSGNNVINMNLGRADDRAEILAWLSPLEPGIRHQAIREQRVEHVGDWLLETEEYRNWFDGIHGGEPNNSVLFCHGDPGVGKTYIR